jgi:hypothetical protein
MTRSGFRETIESILTMQIDRSIILTGLYLTPEQLRVVRPDLEPDDLLVGAIGRSRSVPVFPSGADRSPGGRQDIATTRSHGGIRFSYVQMDVVN